MIFSFSSYGTYMLSAARFHASTSEVLERRLVYERVVRIRFRCLQGLDSLGRVTQVFTSHQVGVGIVVHDRVVFVGAGNRS